MRAWTRLEEVKPSQRTSLLLLRARVSQMNAAGQIKSTEPLENLFSANDIDEILRERGWVNRDAAQTEALTAWIARAACLLGPQASDRASLAELLALVFNY